MAGKHPFSEPRARLSTERCARAARRTKALLEEVNLAKLRQARKVSQEDRCSPPGLVGRAGAIK